MNMMKITQKVNINKREKNEVLLIKNNGRREGDHIPLIHAVVSHLAKAAMMLREKNTRRCAKGNNLSKKEIIQWNIQKTKKRVQQNGFA